MNWIRIRVLPKVPVCGSGSIKLPLRHVRHYSFLSLVKINIVMLEQLGDVDLFVLRQSNLVASQGLTLLLARGNQLILRGGTTREVEIIKYVCKPMK